MSKALLGATAALSAIVCVACAPEGGPGSGEDAEQHQQEAAEALLPDIVVRESDLYDRVIEPVGGQVLLRLSNATANIGLGKLQLIGQLPANPDGTQTVLQRVFSSDGSFSDQVAGQFLYHPDHSHVHFEGWAAYRLRQILPGDGVGAVVAEGQKTSFCIIDISVYDSTLPNFVPGGEFHGCGATTQGLSVGWADVYSKYLTGQNIDITNVPPGEYWLESEVDPDNHIQELDETNNATRVKMTLGALPSAPDAYEPNDTAAAVSLRPPGGPNSPNLGPTNPQRVVEDLTIHSATDVDWFELYVNETGSADDFVRIDFAQAGGDLDLDLADAAGTIVASSAQIGTTSEVISLEGRAEGYYYARVSGHGGATSPNYTLTVDPPANGAPVVAVTAPPLGDTQVIHGLDNYPVTWTASDPENDDTWVTLWLAPTQGSLAGAVEIPTSLNTPGALGSHVVNSAYLAEGATYWVYAQITDGGSSTGAWSPGTVTFAVNPNCGHDICGVGPKLKASCDECVAQICAVDAYCCNTSWDSICVGEVATVCLSNECTCGDGTCNSGETCGTCPSDCGACPSCGDGTCNGAETCSDCPGDCGACPACGDGTCNGTETCGGCPADCGACPACGDGVCNATESCSTCSADCGVCACAHATCVTGTKLFASCDPCVTQICAADPYCCNTSWDSICVGEVASVCGQTCP
jgi:hypothetical protein